MPETLESNHQLTGRQLNLHHLVKADQDSTKLRQLTQEAYGYRGNPKIFYTAATYLTALVHLQGEGEITEIDGMPSQTDAMRAFESYTTLLSMLRKERMSPLFANNNLVANRMLLGSREELVFHAVFAYARGQGADVFALPAPADVDLYGDEGTDDATDIHVYTQPFDSPTYEIQIALSPDAQKKEKYHPRIPVMGITSVLNKQKTADLHRLLWNIGDQEALNIEAPLPPNEHDLILYTAGRILTEAKTWIDSYEDSLVAKV